MRNEKMRVGVEEPIEFAVVTTYQAPTTLAEVQQIAQGDEDYIVACFVRGDRINLQEKSGARDAVRDVLMKLKSERGDALKSEQQLSEADKKRCLDAAQAAIDGFDRLAKSQRGGPRQKTVKLSKNEAKKMSAEVRAALEAQGVKIVVE